jgi:hypothetical protein
MECEARLRGLERIIAVLRYVDPCPGLPCRARRPLPAECRPKFISVIAVSESRIMAVLRYVDLCLDFWSDPSSDACGGLMEIEKYFHSAALAVGLKPSASQGKARLRGLERSHYSKTISPG